MATTISEPARTTPIACEVDCAIVGGSCTGVFAAVRAARLGLRVALIELHNQFGGVATARMVNVWHSLWDLHGEEQIIGSLTESVMRRLQGRGVVIERPISDPGWQFCFNPAELACELDDLVADHDRIRPFLHARMVAAVRNGDDRLTHLVIEDKNGRRAIACRFVIDASGDADVLRRLGIATRSPTDLQPPTMAGIVEGIDELQRDREDFDFRGTIFDPDHPKGLQQGFLWHAPLPGSSNQSIVFGTRVHGVNCADADELTRAEMEGRRQLRNIVDLLNERYDDRRRIDLTAIPASIGIRETHHARCLHQLTEQEVLTGHVPHDSIARGTYRVDIHHQGASGLTFRYLDGREEIIDDRMNHIRGRWRPPIDRDPPCYHVPYRSLVPVGVPNLLVAGRHIDADAGAFGAIRVVVNCNQMGEAAGVAAALALEADCDAASVPIDRLQDHLRIGG